MSYSVLLVDREITYLCARVTWLYSVSFALPLVAYSMLRNHLTEMLLPIIEGTNPNYSNSTTYGRLHRARVYN